MTVLDGSDLSVVPGGVPALVGQNGAGKSTLMRLAAGCGIRVLLVEPGPFRTDFAGRSIRRAPPLGDCEGTPAHVNRQAVLGSDGRQRGDPSKAVDIVFKALSADEPPLRLVLDRPATEQAAAKPAAVGGDIAVWRQRSLATDLA